MAVRGRAARCPAPGRHLSPVTLHLSPYGIEPQWSQNMGSCSWKSCDDLLWGAASLSPPPPVASSLLMRSARFYLGKRDHRTRGSALARRTRTAQRSRPAARAFFPHAAPTKVPAGAERPPDRLRLHDRQRRISMPIIVQDSCIIMGTTEHQLLTNQNVSLG